MAPRCPTRCPFSSAENLYTFHLPGTLFYPCYGTFQFIRVPKWDALLCVITSYLKGEATKPMPHNHAPGALWQGTEWGSRAEALHLHISWGSGDINCICCYKFNKLLFTFVIGQARCWGPPWNCKLNRLVCFIHHSTQPVAWNKVSAQCLLSEWMNEWIIGTKLDNP